MGRSKAAGKPVADLTAEELRRERDRCREFLGLRPNRDSKKRIGRRLREIEARLGGEGGAPT